MEIDKADEQRKDELKSDLLQMGYYKTPDNRQLYELSLIELEQIHADVKDRCRTKKEKK